MKIKISPLDKVIETPSGESLLHILTDAKVEVRSLCKGVPSCGECRVRIIEGEHNCLPPTAKELNVLGSNYFLDGRRLSCQVRCFGDITVDIREQLEQPANLNKKVRGYRPQAGGSARETQAVQDTLILSQNQTGSSTKR
jgi:2Fe-2S ferredoxin